MPDALSAEAKALIDRPNFAHLATLMPDGSPQSTPVSAIALALRPAGLVRPMKNCFPYCTPTP